MEKNKTMINTRLIATPQSLGRIGKSTFNQALISYLQAVKVPMLAIDGDEEHSTLSRWYPKANVLYFSQPEDLLPFFNACGSQPVEIIDFPAQATAKVIESFEKFQAEEIFAQKKVRMTIPIFASDEREGMSSAYEIIQETKDYADYILVKNPARYKSQLFLESKVMQFLKKAPVITLPKITQETLGEIDAVSKKNGKAYTIDEAIDADLPIGSQMELQQWRNTVFSDLQNILEYLVPDKSMVKEPLEFKKRKAKRSKVSALDL